MGFSWHKVSASSKTGKLCTTHFIWEILFWANALRTHIGWRGVTSVQGGILSDYNQIDTHVLKWNPAKIGYPKSLHIRATRDWHIPDTTPFWCYISVGGHPSVTSVQGGILVDYDQNFSRGRDSPDTKFQLPQRLGNYVPLTLYVEILFWANALRTPYWLTWCHVSSGRHIVWLRPNWYTCPEVKSCQDWIILSLFTFQLRAIEIFLPNSVLMLDIRRGPSWCHVSSGRHIGWLQPKL